MDIYMFTYRHRCQISRNNCQNIHTTWLCIQIGQVRSTALTHFARPRLDFRRTGRQDSVTTTRSSTQREISNRSLRQHWLSNILTRNKNSETRHMLLKMEDVCIKVFNEFCKRYVDKEDRLLKYFFNEICARARKDLTDNNVCNVWKRIRRSEHSIRWAKTLAMDIDPLDLVVFGQFYERTTNIPLYFY